ncbi:MAG: ribosome assembly cofactor RimP [Mariprofundaceae bacterium]
MVLPLGKWASARFFVFWRFAGRVEDQISMLLEPIVREIDVTLLAVQVSGGRNRKLVRVTVDKQGGVASDMLARISRSLSLQLDAADLFHAAYQLEVGSPGLEWPLTSQADLDRHQGEWLQVTDLDGLIMEGQSVDSDAKGFSIADQKGKVKHFEWVEVAKVVRAINWKEISSST